MSVFKCKMCGGDLDVAVNEKVVECEYCGSKQTVPNDDDEKKVNLFNRANRIRMACEFDKSAGIYEQIIAEFPEEAEAYWGLCLANYGIEYVDDPATAKKIPTCHRASFEKMRKDENYELAIEYADMAARIVYEDQAKEIDRIMGEILAVSRDEKPYDIFICYKETDSNGKRTPDSILAQEIFDALCAKDYRVFFSRISLEDKLGTQYEPYIFSALNSAKMMLVVGTDYEYMNAVWVKNEWSRFIKLMAKDKSKVLIPCYKDMDPYDMPDEFKPYQSQDCGRLGFVQDLTRGIDKIFGRTEKIVEKVIVQQGGNNANVAPLLERIFMFLEDGCWSEADLYCEKVLDQDPKNAQAYVGKLMAELCVKEQKELKNCAEPFDTKSNYRKAIKFGTDDLVNELKSANDCIIKCNEKARLDSIYDQAVNLMKTADSEAKYKKAAELFGRILEYNDSKKHQKDCLAKAEKQRAKRLEKAEEQRAKLREEKEKQKAEAEDVYNQLIEALKNNGKTETIGPQLEEAENKKQELERLLDEQLRNFETDKNTFRSKISSLNRKKNELQSLNQNKQEVNIKISDLERQRASLGIFAITKKKELNQKIENLSAEKLKLSGDIDALKKESSSVIAVLEALGSEIDIDNRAETLKQDFKVKIQAADNEIELLKKKIEEEKTSGKQKFSLPEIVREIKEKKYIYEFIHDNSKKLESLTYYTNLPFELCSLFDLPFSFGYYPQGKNGERAPIKWIILAEGFGEAFVISKYALDCKKYNSTESDVTWENCSLRTWLNDEFLNNAFSADEQAKIATTNVSAHKNPKYSTNPGHATTDNVFLLSIAEAKKYFTSVGARKCAPTAYAKAQGAYSNDRYNTASGEATTCWWLRSPGSNQTNAASVLDDSSIYYSGHYVLNDAAVRPALWIKLES